MLRFEHNFMRKAMVQMIPGSTF